MNYRESHVHVEMTHVEIMSGPKHMNMNNGEDQSSHNVHDSASGEVNDTDSRSSEDLLSD